MVKVLREDQEDLSRRTYDDWNHGAQNVLDVLSTGGGKSVIIAKMVLEGVRIDQQQVIMAHRNELVAQLSGHIAEEGIPHRIIGSNKTVAQITRQHFKKYGRSFINPSAHTAVAGVDTIIARKNDLKGWLNQTDRWFGDEGHHFLKENKWGEAISLMPNALGLGVTATPLRADGKGLGREYEGIFDTMEIGLDMRSLINIGALVDFEIVCPKSDLSDYIEQEKVSKNGDWSPQAGRKASKKSRIVGDVVGAYCQYAYGKQAICFATDVETAGEIANKFNAAGIRAASLSAKTNPDVREKYIEEFRTGKLTILVNVDLFDEGFDVPNCEVVIMARPTASLGKYRQMAGRMMRTADDKLFGLLIDHVSNLIRHGLPDKYVPWSLARRDKRGKQLKDPNEIELIVCKNKLCCKPYERFRLFCPYCGMKPPLPEPRERSIEMVAGDLILLDRAKLEEMRRATEIETPGNIAERVTAVAGALAGKGVMNKQIEKIEAHKQLKETIAQWAGCERADGFTDSEIYRKFYLTTGTDVLTALDGSRTRQEFETLSKRIEGWYIK